MKLKELLNTLPNDKIVGVGSQSGYVIFATASDTELIERGFKKFKIGYEERLEEYKSRLAYAMTTTYMGDPLDGKAYKSWLAERKSVIRNYKSTLKITKEFLETYINVLDREVTDWFVNLEGGISIIIEGKEIGKYWVLSEYENDKRKVI